MIYPFTTNQSVKSLIFNGKVVLTKEKLNETYFFLHPSKNKKKLNYSLLFGKFLVEVKYQKKY